MPLARNAPLAVPMTSFMSRPPVRRALAPFSRGRRDLGERVSRGRFPAGGGATSGGGAPAVAGQLFPDDLPHRIEGRAVVNVREQGLVDEGLVVPAPRRLDEARDATSRVLPPAFALDSAERG